MKLMYHIALLISATILFSSCGMFNPAAYRSDIRMDKQGNSEEEFKLFNPSTAQINALDKYAGQKKVLSLLEQGKITSAEANQLIDTIKKFPDDTRVYIYENNGHWYANSLLDIDNKVENNYSTGNWQH